MNGDSQPEHRTHLSLMQQIVPTIVTTKHGNVEYAAFGEGPAVVSIHGAMGGYDQSILLAQTIAEAGYFFIAVSRPGYLGTPMTSGRTPEEQADLFAALLDELVIDDTAIMAVSGGGPSAIHFALRHPDRCRGLVLVSTCSGPIEQNPPLMFKLTQLLARIPFFVSMMRRKVENNLEGALGRSIADPVILKRTIADPEVRPLVRDLLLSTYDRMVHRLPGTENDIRITREASYALEDISIPVLVVHGTEDRLVPFEQHAKQHESRIPGAELLALEDGEHVAIFTHRDEVRTRVTQFLKTITSDDP